MRRRTTPIGWPHRAPGALTPEMIAADIHITTGTVKKYLTALIAKGIVGEDGAPTLKCKDKEFFTLPNEVFLLQLPPSAFLVYAYLLLIEDRQTHTCHPSGLSRIFKAHSNTLSRRKYAGYISTNREKPKSARWAFPQYGTESYRSA